MDGIRRTVPRSARRAPRPSTTVAPPAQNGPSGPPSARHSTAKREPTDRYIPLFTPAAKQTSPRHPSASPETSRPSAPWASALPDSEKQVTPPSLHVRAAAVSRIRWLRGGERDAIAAAAISGDDPLIALYAVRADAGVVSSRLKRDVSTPSHVAAMAAGTDGLLVTGCVDGSLLALSGSKEESELQKVGQLPGGEAIAGVDVLRGNSAVAAGDHGTLSLVDLNESPVWTARADDVGFRALAACGDAGEHAVTAGAAGVTVWDVRCATHSALKLSGNGAALATAVAADASQPHFVQAGLRDGAVVVWDRRAPQATLGRVDAHNGPVWDVRVIACTARPGRLVTGGEDGQMWVLDYACAAARAGGEGWSESGEVWRATIAEREDVHQIGKTEKLPVNSVDAHDEAALFAYGTDGAAIVFDALPQIL